VLSRDDGHITKGSYVFNIQPPQSQQSQKEIISTSQKANALSESSVIDNINLTLIITPFYVGQNTFNVTLTNESGTSPFNLRNVILSLVIKRQLFSSIGVLSSNVVKTTKLHQSFHLVLINIAYSTHHSQLSRYVSLGSNP
jgi:hypothetical protein